MERGFSSLAYTPRAERQPNLENNLIFRASGIRADEDGSKRESELGQQTSGTFY
jgi:hypothetical protein